MLSRTTQRTSRVFQEGSGRYAATHTWAAGLTAPAISGGLERQEPEAMYRPGDRVVYTATKHSAHPGPRAEAVQPEQHGEGYWYDVKKYWLVVNVRPDGLLTVITRRGKERSVASSDPRLRPARWWESLFFRDRFPRLTSVPSDGQPSRSSAA